MSRRARPALLLLLPLLAIAVMQARGSDDDVTIYRCTDARGQLSVGNTPCAKGQQQETRTMLRPKDAPASAMTPNETPVEPLQPVLTPRVVIAAAAPRPLYECVRSDGSVYESDSGDGDPRWVPLWTLGYPDDGVGLGSPVGRGSVSASRSNGMSASRSSGLSAPPSSSISIPPPWERPRPPVPPPSQPRPPHDGHHPGFGYGAGTWVRDECHALPQGEVCARLADRREKLRRRFFNAQQRERDVLRVEERGLNARLANDCGVD